MEVETGQMSTGLEILLDNRRGAHTMKEYRLKVEIAQRTLSDLGRVACLHADHAEA